LIRLASQRRGILAFKYVKLIDQKYIVEKDDKGEAIKRVAMYERKLEVDPITGEVTKDELELPTHAEDFTFEPPCKDKTTLHSVKISMIRLLSLQWRTLLR
jgi:hypothetical protein